MAYIHFSMPSILSLARYAAAFAAGFTASYATVPTSLWPMMVAGFSLFYVCLLTSGGSGRAYLIGFLFALGYFLKGLWWVGNALLIEGNEYAWVWPLAVLGLPTLLATFTGLASAIVRILTPKVSLSSLFLFAALIAISEWVRGTIFTGFPWNLYGTAWVGTPVLQTVSLIGIYGLTLTTVFWSAIPGFLYLWPVERNKKISFAVLAIASLAAAYGWGWHRLSSGAVAYREDIAVRAIQPNIEQSMKWDAESLINNFQRHLALSVPRIQDKTNPARVTLLVWPETAMPPYVAESRKARGMIAGALSEFPGDAYLISGVLRAELKNEKRAYYNSVYIIDEKGRSIARYDKTHLVPFGEFIPFQEWLPIKPVVEFSGFQAGNGPDSLSAGNAPAFSPLICYEIIFSGRIMSPAAKAEWIVAVTNDAWYGRSAGPHQHFSQAVIRAIEEGVPVVRSANTGISGIIDPYGRVIQQKGLFEEGIVESRLPQAISDGTLFSRTGNFVFLLLVLLSLAPHLRGARGSISGLSKRIGYIK